MFKQYKFGGFKTEIQKLLRKRLDLKHKVRYHTLKRESLEKKMFEVEKELDKYLKMADN